MIRLTGGSPALPSWSRGCSIMSSSLRLFVSQVLDDRFPSRNGRSRSARSGRSISLRRPMFSDLATGRGEARTWREGVGRIGDGTVTSSSDSPIGQMWRCLRKHRGLHVLRRRLGELLGRQQRTAARRRLRPFRARTRGRAEVSSETRLPDAGYSSCSRRTLRSVSFRRPRDQEQADAVVEGLASAAGCVVACSSGATAAMVSFLPLRSSCNAKIRK